MFVEPRIKQLSREAALAVVKDNGFVRYTHLTEKLGERELDEMVKRHYLVYQPLPSISGDLQDTSVYPILTAPSPTHLWTLRKGM